MEIISKLQHFTVTHHRNGGYYDLADRDKVYIYNDKIELWENKVFKRAIEEFKKNPDPNKTVKVSWNIDVNMLELAVTTGQYTIAEEVINLPGFNKELNSNLMVLVNYPEIDVLNLFIKKGLNVLDRAKRIIENTKDVTVVDTICKMGYRMSPDWTPRYPGVATILVKYGYVIPRDSVRYATGKVLEELLMLDPTLIDVRINGNDPLQHCLLLLLEVLAERRTPRYKNRTIMRDRVYTSTYNEHDNYDSLREQIAPFLRMGCKIGEIQPSGIHAFEDPELKDIIMETGLLIVPTFDDSDDEDFDPALVSELPRNPQGGFSHLSETINDRYSSSSREPVDFIGGRYVLPEDRESFLARQRFEEDLRKSFLKK